MPKPKPKQEIKTIRHGLKFRWQLWIACAPVRASEDVFGTRNEARESGKRTVGLR